MSEDAFNAIKKSPESADIALPDTYKEYIAYISEFNRKIEEENSLRAKFRAENQASIASIRMETKEYKENLAAFKARMDARGGYDIKNTVDVNRNNLTKKQIREEQNLLNIRQQSYTSLASIQQSLSQKSLKAGGISDGLVTENQNVTKLIDAYKALDEAKRLEGLIVTGSVVESQDTPEAEQAQLRKLTLDQLKYARTVAWSANNHSLMLQIMMEETRIQQEIVRRTSMNNEASKVAGTATAATTRNVKEMSKSLQESSKRGFDYARSILKGLSYTKQMNDLLTQQKLLAAQTQQDNYKKERDNKDLVKQAEEVNKAIKSSQESSGEYFVPEKKAADLEYMKSRKDFALAQEQFAKANESNNAEEKARLLELARINADNAKTASAAGGNTYGLKQITDFIDELDNAKVKANELNIIAQQNALKNYFKFDENNQFNATESFKKYGEAFNELLTKRQEALNKLNDPSQKLNEKDKSEFQNIINEANAKLSALNALYPQLEQAAKAAGQSIPVNLKPILPQELVDAERGKITADTVVPVSIDTTVADEQNDLFRAKVAQPITVPVNMITSSSSTPVTEEKATGGFIPGYGGGDRVHALLEQGEFILRKEAVRKLGLNNVFSLNNLNIPKPARSVDKMSIPSFSGGGYVGSSNTININVPGSKSIQVSGSRESAMALANLLTRVGRAV
jgi:hypothetical protein